MPNQTNHGIVFKLLHVHGTIVLYTSHPHESTNKYMRKWLTLTYLWRIIVIESLVTIYGNFIYFVDFFLNNEIQNKDGQHLTL